jgi:predicted transcriptional regulator of viral defense system
LGVDRPEAAGRLARWAKQGWLRRVRRDLYIPVPVGAVDPGSWSADPLMLADAVWGPCYVTGWSSANHWALTEQSFRTTVIRTSGTVRASDQRLLDHDYLLAHVAEDDLRWGMTAEWRDGRRISMADRARTIVDVLDNPRLGGGIRLVAEFLSAYLEDQDPLTLIDYADRVGNRTVFKRLGLLAEHLGGAEDLVAECATRLSQGYPLLDPTQPPGGPRSTRWRIVQNVRLQLVEPS